MEKKSLLIPDEVHTRIKKYCTNKGVKIQHFVERVLTNYLDENEKTLKNYNQIVQKT